MSFIFGQAIAGLASAASLFLIASGLSVIFGVTRVVNFAHGSFYMLGAYAAYSIVQNLGGAVGFWTGIVVAAVLVAVAAVPLEMLVLRRLYRAPELFQLLATFGVSLMIQDLVVLGWGPEDLIGRQAPYLTGAVHVFSTTIPTYDLFLICLGPAVLLFLWALFRFTRWGALVRAATEDREMISALGVNQKWLFTAVFALGVFLAALGGALQIAREAVTHTMDTRVIVEAFVVVVIGGLGSIVGAFVAAILVCEVSVFGQLVFPTMSLVIVFLVMAAVLIFRPWGLFGEHEAAPRTSIYVAFNSWRALRKRERLAVCALLIATAMIPLIGNNYLVSVCTELLIFSLFAASLQLLISVGGLVSFGHAAMFGLGSYGAALLATRFGCPMAVCLALGPLLSLVGAVVIGWFCVRLTGVYFAMLTLAFAQIVWSVAFQWVSVTGGDNGILGVWPAPWASRPAPLFLLTLAVTTLGLAALRTLVFSPFGYALRATRDSTLRADAIGIRAKNVQWVAFLIAGTFAGVAGSLFAFVKGSVFPDNLGIPLSLDALTMVLLGGIDTVSGGIVGAFVYKSAFIWLISKTDYSKLVLGAFIVALVLIFPEGIVGSLQRWFRRIRHHRNTKAIGPEAHLAVDSQH